MKWLLVILYIIFCIFPASLITTATAQESESLEWDIDTVFDAPSSGTTTEAQASGEAEGPTVLNLVKRRGFNFDVSYWFAAGITPGWTAAPWETNVKREFSLVPGIDMSASMALNAQVTEYIRVTSNISYGIPNFSFTLGDFFFDYNINNAVFIRGGKYGHSWGSSGLTNLLARVPAGSSGGESYILKADIPIGIGGIQVLALTRANIAGGNMPGLRDIGIGGKYNLALRWADIDIGAFYQSGMPFRGFLSLKTTVGRTEFYHGWLAAIDLKQPEKASGAANIGFARDFFDGKLTLSGGLEFNAEENAFWYIPETKFREAETTTFYTGLSGSLSFLYRFDAKGSPRLFTQLAYLPLDNSAQFMPGFRLSPGPDIEMYFAVPMAFGSRESYYYTHTADSQNRPFSIIMLIGLGGGFQYGYYY